MSPTAIVALIQLILTESPGAIAAIRQLLNKENPSPADYESARAQILADSFASLAPNAAAFSPPRTS